jgi:hypothetical protein
MADQYDQLDVTQVTTVQVFRVLLAATNGLVPRHGERRNEATEHCCDL